MKNRRVSPDLGRSRRSSPAGVRLSQRSSRCFERRTCRNAATEAQSLRAERVARRRFPPNAAAALGTPACGGAAHEDGRETQASDRGLACVSVRLRETPVGRRCRPTCDASVSAACALISVTPCLRGQPRVPMTACQQKPVFKMHSSLLIS